MMAGAFFVGIRVNLNVKVGLNVKADPNVGVCPNTFSAFPIWSKIVLNEFFNKQTF